jgi:hypothetical protein
MTTAAQRRAASQPARMESHPVHRPVGRPYCTLQELDPEDLQQTMCDTIQDEEQRLTGPLDPATYRLHVEFVRAHGLPKGEYTTFCNGSMLSISKTPARGRED